MKYDERTRKWYTKDNLDEPLDSNNQADVMPFTELEAHDTTGRGEFAKIPKIVQVGDERFAQIRLRHGLILDVNLNNGDVTFTERSLAAMEIAAGPPIQDDDEDEDGDADGDAQPANQDESAKVTLFWELFEDTLRKMAVGGGQVLGTLYYSLI